MYIRVAWNRGRGLFLKRNSQLFPRRTWLHWCASVVPRVWCHRFAPRVWCHRFAPECGAIVLLEFSWNVRGRPPRSPLIEEAAGGSDGQEGRGGGKRWSWGWPERRSGPRKIGFSIGGRRRARLTLGRPVGGLVSGVVAGAGQAGALNGRDGGNAHRGNISASSRARSRRRWAPAR